ncbi:hypothetical protein S7711_07294 [Stachybotrys chartarum IBT 7711]|uniref:Transcription factor domain-containing protein n=1 Tax=Stachybotrys chartarum (strain CBS 109288 / IBT 7711) TaxID=1280523 RepID=A0A084BA09_STACB|nr:hypothetical protein S7711_07294 [Stachybotrys chartarum IBT 7711]KFA54237.1 hypothetical protein S40293_08157 [Stachybotrys chartarum IBT 40293]
MCIDQTGLLWRISFGRRNATRRSQAAATAGDSVSSAHGRLEGRIVWWSATAGRRTCGCPAESHLDPGIAGLPCQPSEPTTIDPLIVDTTAARSEDLLETLSPVQSWIDILPQSFYVPPALSPSTSSPSPAEGHSLNLCVPSLIPDLKSADDKALLNHYKTVVSAMLSRCADVSVNPYITYLLPMAISDSTILHAVLALSATHWQRLKPEMQSRALFHQGRAMQSLAILLPHVERSSIDIALVSCLLLCMTELFDGASTGWKLHLQGAKRLFMNLRLQHGDKVTGHSAFIVKLTRFLDSAATTSTCKPPLIEDEIDAEMDDFPDLAGDDAAVYGIPKELFHLVDRINNLASKRGTRVNHASEALFREEANKVQEHLDNWALDYGGLPGACFSRACE